MTAPRAEEVTAPRAQEVTACRACDAPDLLPFLSLGQTPVANALLRAADDPSPAYPLEVGFCRRCTLVQLLHVLPAEVIFDADYAYFSSYSEALDTHSRQHCAALVERGLAADALVVEVASNDGYLLRHLLGTGVRLLGIEPSPGPAALARERGVPTEQVMLGPEQARRLRSEHGPAAVVLANNVMAHVPDLQGFVASMAHLLADDGILQVENPGVRWLLENVEFDTIYHEHYCYFSTTAVRQLMRAHGLELNDVELFPDLQGGTLRWTCSRSPEVSERAARHLREEAELGLTGPGPYLAFGDRVAALQAELRRLLAELAGSGARIAAYGAAAKGATLLNATGIGADLIDFVVDLNPHKQGRWLPGARLPIVDPAVLLERQPDYVLVLAWNYLAEVRRQQAAYERAGGAFVVPVPWPTVLGPSATGTPATGTAATGPSEPSGGTVQ